MRTYRSSVIRFLKAFLTAFALSVEFHTSLHPSWYESTPDYIIASVYELLGSYDFTFLLLLCISFCFYRYAEGHGLPEKGASKGLSAFFAGCLLIGQSYYETGTWDYCFGSGVNLCKTALAFLGFAFLFHAVMALLLQALAAGSFTEDKEHFFRKHAFLKAFLIILGAYSPFLLLSFPGNLCWDVIGQIEQVTLGTGYSTHHPLVHTLIVGGLTQLGKNVFGSYEVGLFLYMLMQAALFSAALAATIAVLARRGVKKSLLVVLLLLYCITPVYSNVVSTALKDVPFCAFVIGYVICYALIMETPALLRNWKFAAAFIGLQIGVILLRNNGLYVVLLAGIGACIFLYKKYSLKERLGSLLVFFGAGVVISKIVLLLLTTILSATPGSKGEILSIPFQQTARYLQVYRSEISAEEKAAIEAVLGDVETIAGCYDPAISDPVKALFKKDATGAELAAYIGAWFKGLFKHPAVYVEAFLVHIYGWFTPTVSNTIRYEAAYDLIKQGGLFPNAEKLLIFYYRFANRFTPLGVLENTGAAVWAMFFLGSFQKREKRRAQLLAGLPLWVSLLICMASPCFFMHPRYAFPILFTLPFLYGFTLSAKK